MVVHQLIAAATADAGGNVDWIKFFSLALGLYGAVVASLVALYNFRRDRPKVSVELTGEVHFKKAENELFWQIRIQNERARPVTIETVGLVDSDGVRLGALLLDDNNEPWSPPFPVTLGDNEHLTVRTRRSLDDDVVGAFAMDYRHNFYEGKSTKRVWRWSPRQIKMRRIAEKQEQRHPG